jgi:metal-responsive CopG/Arc/MetJ family transcriptional regulator
MQTRRRKNVGAVRAARRVVVEFPEPLLRQADRAAAELAIDRSKLIRSAVEQYLEVLRQHRLQIELAAGYAANASLDRQICSDFSHVDAENI